MGGAAARAPGHLHGLTAQRTGTAPADARAGAGALQGGRAASKPCLLPSCWKQRRWPSGEVLGRQGVTPLFNTSPLQRATLYEPTCTITGCSGERRWGGR